MTEVAAGPVLVELAVRVNGEERSLVVDTRTSLLDLRLDRVLDALR